MVVKINRDKCMYCGGCVGLCPVNALTLQEVRLVVSNKCTECGICIQFCPVGALQ